MNALGLIKFYKIIVDKLIKKNYLKIIIMKDSYKSAK